MPVIRKRGGGGLLGLVPVGSAFTKFLSTWGALIIALAALAQPWIRAVYRRFLRPGRIDIYETGMIEVGYGPLGPSLALLGTVRSVDRDFFVTSMEVQVTKLKDHSQHTFEWAAFRPLTMAPHEMANLQVPAGFMLSTIEPLRYNVVFLDRDGRRDQQTALDPLESAWRDRTDSESMRLITTTPGGTSADDFMDLLEKARSDIYFELVREPLWGAVHGDVDRLCYWDAGRYGVVLEVRTGDKAFHKSWTFDLRPADEKGLRANVYLMMDIALGRPTGRQLYGPTVNYEPD